MRRQYGLLHVEHHCMERVHDPQPGRDICERYRLSPFRGNVHAGRESCQNEKGSFFPNTNPEAGSVEPVKRTVIDENKNEGQSHRHGL